MALFYRKTTYDKKSQFIALFYHHMTNIIKTPFYGTVLSSNKIHMIKTPLFGVVLSSNELHLIKTPFLLFCIIIE